MRHTRVVILLPQSPLCRQLCIVLWHSLFFFDSLTSLGAQKHLFPALGISAGKPPVYNRGNALVCNTNVARHDVCVRRVRFAVPRMCLEQSISVGFLCILDPKEMPPRRNV